MLCYAKSLQSCPTLCDPIDGSPPGSPVPGILQARTLEWVAISFSNAWKWKVKAKLLSCVWLLATPWTAAYQALPSMGFSRQEYWSGVPLPSPVPSHTKAITNFLIKLKIGQSLNCNTFQNSDDKKAILSRIWDAWRRNYFTRAKDNALILGCHYLYFICKIPNGNDT